MPVQYLKLDPPDPCATHTFACDQAHINVEHINQDELDILCYVLAEVEVFVPRNHVAAAYMAACRDLGYYRWVALRRFESPSEVRRAVLSHLVPVDTTGWVENYWEAIAHIRKARQTAHRKSGRR